MLSIHFLKEKLFLPIGGVIRQDSNGSPVYPGGQLQIGLWLTTRQSALAPHDPGQGSRHFCEIQDLSYGQSLLI